MKVGNLVKYRFRMQSTGAEGIGLVTNVCNTTDVFENRLATILWGAMGRISSHRFALLEVINESR